jgi:hypothetical protein
VSDTWNPERQLIGTLKAHTVLQLKSKVRGLAYRTHWRPERQSSHTERFLLAAVLSSYYFLNFSDLPFNSCEFFYVLTLLHKTGSHLEASCSFPDANLESGKELYV